jgi:hypothetical protein
MLKIGLLIKNPQILCNWHLRIIQSILNDKDLKLAHILTSEQNGLKQKNHTSRRYFAGSYLARIFFNIQLKLESKFFPSIITVNKEEILQALKNISTSKFSDEEHKIDEDLLNQIKSEDLDVLIRLDFDVIPKPFLALAKHGVWSFHFSEMEFNGCPPSFWELVLNQKDVSVILLQHHTSTQQGYVIDEAFYNKSWSLLETSNFVYEGSVSLLTKNLNKLEEGLFEVREAYSSKKRNNLNPSGLHLLKYAQIFYKNLFRKIYEVLSKRYLKSRYDCWTIFIGSGDFTRADLNKLKPIEPPPYQFWADPFIVEYDRELYLFFENFDYPSLKGKISCSKINGNQLGDIQDVLELDTHLSYPCIFKENGDVFLMPESASSNRLTIYRCIEFPNKWEEYSHAFEGEQILDAQVYFDDENTKWLFLNKTTPSGPNDGELHIYQMDSISMENLIPHKRNPVIINSRKARNGGPIFKHGKDLIRPSQYNSEGIYGRGLNLQRIVKLSLEEYEEETITTIYPDFKEGLSGIHHLHQTEENFVIDAVYRKFKRQYFK